MVEYNNMEVETLKALVETPILQVTPPPLHYTLQLSHIL